MAAFRPERTVSGATFKVLDDRFPNVLPNASNRPSAAGDALMDNGSNRLEGAIQYFRVSGSSVPTAVIAPTVFQTLILGD